SGCPAATLRPHAWTTPAGSRPRRRVVARRPQLPDWGVVEVSERAARHDCFERLDDLDQAALVERRLALLVERGLVVADRHLRVERRPANLLELRAQHSVVIAREDGHQLFDALRETSQLLLRRAPARQLPKLLFFPAFPPAKAGVHAHAVHEHARSP